MSAADDLISQFNRMVRRDGGSLSLLEFDGEVIRVGYQLGADPTCVDGACIMPYGELQQLMAETLARRDPSLRVVVEPVSAQNQ
jgi:hypothetical protein